MERKKLAPEVKATEGMIQYRKLGGGSLRLPNRIIKPNERFYARPEDIPAAFRNLLQVLSSDETVAAIEKTKEEVAKKNAEPENLFTIEPAEDQEGFFNVINSVDKKAINDTPLRKKAAENLLATLEE